MLTKSHDHAKYPTELIPNKNSASLNIQQNVTTSTALPPFGSLYRRPRAAAREYTPPLGLGDMSAATDRDVAPTPNPTPPPDLEMAVYGDGSAAAGSNDDAPSRAACPSCANTAAVGGFAQTDCLGCASCSTGVENEEDEEEPAAPSRAPSKEELLDVHRNVVLLLKAMKERSAKGAKRQGRYRKHDTARKHVVTSIVSSTFEPMIMIFVRSCLSVCRVWACLL